MRNNIDTVIVNEDGTKSYLEYIEKDGTLMYVSVFNSGAAITSNVNELYDGGSLGLDLTGNGITVGVWDGGRARPTHQELAGKITHLDAAPTAPVTHSTHVTGIIVATGINPFAKGMAINAIVNGYDFFFDDAEMQSEAGSGLLISNHSYGLTPSQLPDWFFGAYIQDSRNTDLIMNSAPFYLPVFAAGNSRNNSPANNPSKNGFDLITSQQASKNALVVANVLQVDNYTGPGSVDLSSSSSWGPTDDLRVKPDISAKGTNVFSTYSQADDAYGNLSGTSMYSPVVAGTVALLQELNFNVNGVFLKSHEIKALLCGTTLPAGDFGPAPDVKFGFGLMNAEKAADVILNNGFSAHFEEIPLNQSQNYSETFSSLDPSIPIEVTIAWNDPAGETQQSGSVDDTEPRLVNNLDLRVFDENGNEVFPYILRSFIFQHSPGTGDNNADNIEKIHIANPVGDYTIQVTHKGNLTGGTQDFSLVVTGVGDSKFNVLAVDNTVEVCPDEVANFEFSYNKIPSFSEAVTFQATGLPGVIDASFSPNSVTENTIVNLQLTNLNTLSTGNYDFEVIAQGGGETKNTPFVLTVLEGGEFGSLEVGFPTSDMVDVRLNPTYTWSQVDSAQEYLVEVSQDVDFANVLFSITRVSVFMFSPVELAPETTYYWRIKPSNDCLEGDFVQDQFTTETLTCGNLISAVDLPITIDAASAGVYESIITAPDDFVGQISKLTLSVDISHDYVGDLIISLISPSGTEVVLIDQECDSGGDIVVTFDDTADTFTCNTTSSPAISGIIKPQSNLSEFIGEEVQGDWILRVEDVFNQDGGSINSFEIDFCNGTSTLSSTSFEQQNFQIYPNPASSTVNISFGNTTSFSGSLKLYDLNGRVLLKADLNSSLDSHQLDVSRLNSGMYIILIDIGGSRFSQKLIVK